MGKLRLPAIPLITVDPYFSIWSFDDTLYGDVTRHWTGNRNSMCGMIKVNGKVLRFLGKVQDSESYYIKEPDVIEQTNVNVTPTKTEYQFKGYGIELTVRFITPLLMDDLLLLARPVSYIEYEISGEGAENAELYFDICTECCVNDNLQPIKFFSGDYGIFCGNSNQEILNKSGDNVMIDWGYLHLLEKNAYFANVRQSRIAFIYNSPVNIFKPENEFSVSEMRTVMAVTKRGDRGLIAVAYDDLKSIEYFGKHLNAYYKSNGDTFEKICQKALTEFKDIKAKCENFDNYLMNKAKCVSDEYADIISATYRQAIAAHKLCYDDKGLLFISKECYSNACAATLDVTYPSMPLFLLLNSELVKAMMRPIFEFADTDDWKYVFAPHDCGQYPLLNGQVYGKNDETGELSEDMQMPVEECGNALLTVFAICKHDKDFAYAKENEALLKKWGKYLYEFAKDPGNQLCTDDFCGHMAHNCNLSIKGILGLYACGEMFGIDDYKEKAKTYAAWWQENAFEDDHYKLTFDSKNSFSIKYNLIWDKLLGFNIFDKSICECEAEYYKRKMCKYGIPLDSRDSVSKIDWVMWAAALSDDKEYRDMIIHSICNMINETKHRVPLADRYDVITADEVLEIHENEIYGFSNRSVVGGLAILLLEF